VDYFCLHFHVVINCVGNCVANDTADDDDVDDDKDAAAARVGTIYIGDICWIYIQ